MPLECGKPGKLPCHRCHRCHDSCQPFANHLGIISNISNHPQISWYIWYWYPKQMVCFGIYHAIGKENGHRKEQTFRWSASQCGDCMDPRAGATSQSLTTSPWQCVGQGPPWNLLYSVNAAANHYRIIAFIQIYRHRDECHRDLTSHPLTTDGPWWPLLMLDFLAIHGYRL